MSTSPINHAAPIGQKYVQQFDTEGNMLSPSTLASEPQENTGFNPDFRPSSGRSREEENAIGKGANPSADVVTKNHTTIDPVHGEPSPAVDGETIVDSVPAVLPEGAVITEPSGEVHVAGVAPKSDFVEQTEPVPAVMRKPIEEIEAERVAAEERYAAAEAARAESVAEEAPAPKAKSKKV